MFGGLKERLKEVRNRLGSTIQGAETPAAPGATGSPPVSATATAAEATVKKTSSAAPPSFVDKVKILVRDRELVVSEKDLLDALSELEMTLLESDVALPVTDAIISHVREDLVGKHRKIGESVD
ncbi:MAG: signal recognition particle receptor subunit alpha, partial [Methanoregula sp.]